MTSKPSCLIVMYHYVGGCEGYSGIHGPIESAFAEQVDGLCKSMEPIDWPTLYAWTRGQGSIPDRCFLLTFDDGLLGHVRVADLLMERGLRGTFLVPGAVLGGDVLLPAHAIHCLLSKANPAELQMEILRKLDSIPDQSRATAMYHYETSPTVACVKYLLTVAIPRDQRNAIIRELFEKYVGGDPAEFGGQSMADYAAQWYMNANDLRRMQAAGHTIGGHGFSHEPYGGMTPTKQMEDMLKVRWILHEALGDDMQKPRPFSYPYGQYKGGAEMACRNAGFNTAFTTERRWADDTCGPFRLPRVDAMYLEANNDAGFTVEPEATDGTVPAMSGVRED